MKLTYQPTPDGREAYRVDSDSGNAYTITYCGSGDGDPDFVGVWQCDCPAGKCDRDCKHLKTLWSLPDRDDPIEAGTVVFEG